ncbi:MAG: hypothetical protein IKR09_01880 [Alphaproteobacteria bacterium]|nr:hypothetical protein [Alphaproteobacteria bacterium]
MAEPLTFKYGKNYFFVGGGLVEILLATVLISPFLLCSGCWRWAMFVHWWYLYVFPVLIGLVLLRGGIVNLHFWFAHVRKKPYLTITDDMLLIDAETDIKIADIVSIAPYTMLGCTMLCLELKNPQDYKLSWRFRADKLFHKKYDAFICPDLIDPKQKAACLEWFERRFPNPNRESV